MKGMWIVLYAVTIAVGLDPVTAQADVQTWDAFAWWHTDSNTSDNLWQYMSAANDGVNDDYLLLPNFYPVGTAGDAWWHGTTTDIYGLPFVGSDGAQLCVHPGRSAWGTPENAVIAWKSPISGTVSARFSLTDLDAPGYTYLDGVNYYLFKSGASDALSSGVVQEGSASGLITVYNIEVANGDMLYLQIGCGGVDKVDSDLTGISFSITRTYPGDATGDGAVDSSDAAALAANWLAGPDATWNMGDFNDDGYVNDIDATLLAANWQKTAAASVPEPAAWMLLLGAALSLIVTRRRMMYCISRRR